MAFVAFSSISAQAIDQIQVTDKILIDGSDFTAAVTIEQVKELLGEPDRATQAANVIYTWDQQGITAYTRRDSDQVIEICLQLKKEIYPFSPAASFAGTITVAGVRLASDTAGADLEAAGFKKETVFEAYSYRYASDTVNVNLDTVHNRLGWTRVSILYR